MVPSLFTVVANGSTVDAGDDGAGVGGRAVARHMDAAVALALDDRGVVVGHAQRHLGAELLGRGTP